MGKVTEKVRHDASEWAGISSLEARIGCPTETARRWVRRVESGGGRWPGLARQEAERLTVLEWESRELRRASEILRKASAIFTQGEPDRRPR